jgi:hypothetical protein
MELQDARPTSGHGHSACKGSRAMPAALRCFLAALCASLLAAGAERAGAAERSFDAGAEAGYDTNVTRAQLRDDIRADGFVTGHASASLRWPLDEVDAASLGAGVRAAQFLRFPRLSYLAAEASASWHRKLALGLTAPWIDASALVAHEWYGDRVRNSDRLEARLATGRRFSERLDASFGYVYDRRYATHDESLVPGISGAVWDVAGHAGFVRAGYALTDAWQLEGGYAYRRGDVVSTTHRNLAIFLASDAIGESHAFGPDFFDYRLRGTTQTGAATLSYALGDYASLDLNYAYAFTRAAQGLQYQGHVVTASWSYRY